MGHHSAAFTLNVYGHLMDSGVGEALPLPGGNEVATSAALGEIVTADALDGVSPV
jgi:hypothetical protein